MATSTSKDQQHAALAARYGSELPPECGPWNETIAALLSHRSVRKYLPKPLPDNTVTTLAAAAQSAATSSNLQTWSLIAVTDPALKARLSAVAAGQKHIIECPLFLVWVADLSRLRRVGEQKQQQLAALNYLEMLLVATIDAALAAQNAVVAAESLGLSTVYIGALRNDTQRVAAELDLPDSAVGVFGLCVGYADHSVPAEVKPRLPQSVVVHRDLYDVAGEPARLDIYDQDLAEFSRRNELSVSNWTNRVIARTKELGAMAGRDKLAAALRALGFPLS
ncbi:NADPH-dependent oxidoreductase [Sodalis ligni]|uniref:NADPH-dependent oxidoreductase n=1 Tax=Sodalis ligni TaxID=2697027 RepID=UPI00193EFBB2|nr:NADPH-dependent oxidoreductase [Sodalis ligni]QWA11006.1 NADPH-dependent oxidoreductase [Sodalis ligni]